MTDRYKLNPRNATAWSNDLVAGNTVTTRLESGVGNCFPGLEFDIRNLERRFFPFLTVDFVGSVMIVAGVDLVGARSAGLSTAEMTVYEQLAQDLADQTPDLFWLIVAISSNFGPFGDLDLTSESFDSDDTSVPADAWTAARLIPAGANITLGLSTFQGPTPPFTHQLFGRRVPYLDDDGVLNEMFAPGELTQSLCSPWTHDFRDCGCFYWASNHPDIALPLRNPGPPDARFDRPVPWQRSDRGTVLEPSPAASDAAFADEMRHYEISHRWQELGIVLDRREQPAVYVPSTFTAEPFANEAELVAQMRYAAGVELSVMLEYLSAAYSLDRNASGGSLNDDVNASFSEIMRIAIGEMKHVRAANDILRAFAERGLISSFEPVLRLVDKLPAGGNLTRPVAFRPLTMATLDSFIDIERPSFSIDGLYGRVLESVRRFAPGPLEAIVESIMADGTDHFDTFSFVKEWLGRHNESDYLLDVSDPEGSPIDADLQVKFGELIDLLFRAYDTGLPGSGLLISQSQAEMIASPDGIRGKCEALADSGFAVRFVMPAGDRFTPVTMPSAGV